MAAEVGGVEDQQDGVGFRQAGRFAFEDVVGDLLVFGARIQAVDAWEIDEVQIVVRPGGGRPT